MTKKFLSLEQYLDKINCDSEKYFDFDNHILKVTTDILPFNFNKLFNNKNSTLKFEIGFGNGASLIELARRNPEINYFGIDRKMDRARKALSKLKKEGEEIPNLIISRIGTDYIKDMFTPETFDEIIMNFPDPWPKKKHHKHRTINKEFIKNIHWLLKSNGVFRFTSDHWEYSLEVITLFGQYSDLFINSYHPEPYKNKVKNRIETQFEKHKKAEGYTIQYTKFQKI